MVCKRRFEQRGFEQQGFTLVELLVVVLIIGVLMAVAIPSFLALTASGRARSAESNVTVALADEEAYYVSHSAYGTPASSPSIAAVDSGLNWCTSGSCPTSSGADKRVSVLVTTVGTPSSDAVILGAVGTDTKDYWVLVSQSTSTPGPLFIVNSSSTAPTVSTFTSTGKATWALAGG